MLLALDVGNTNSVIGVFRQKQLVANWRLTTARDQTIDAESSRSGADEPAEDDDVQDLRQVKKIVEPIEK